MNITTTHSIGDEVYVIGMPEGGCEQPGCMDCAQGESPHWAILSIPRPDGSFGPCTVSAVLIMEPDPDAEEEADLTDKERAALPEFEVYYAVREAPGQFFPEELCYTDVDEAGALVERLNAGNAMYQQ